MTKEIPISCCYTVFTKEERFEYKNIWRGLELRRISITEIEKGYQHLFPGDSETLRLLNEWIGLERRCCPFLTFTVIANNEDKTIRLQLTGNEEVKAFLQNEIDENIKVLTT
ncbi:MULTISPECIES: hypothetical protein [Paenibacillus]|uniref:hypothetical protein n=1 Tax=Paenibacillus TaxID=44249 RepID=UPI001E54A5DB|nr:hypothetical protein [Paenibacillus sp. IHBB 10380]